MPAPAPDPAGPDPVGSHELDDLLRSSTQALTAVRGVVGVTLGGSRARETADAAADVDLGVYYRAGSLDLAALATVPTPCTSPAACSAPSA